MSPPPTHRLSQQTPLQAVGGHSSKPPSSDADSWDELWGAADVSALVSLVTTMPPGAARAARLSQLDAAWSVMAPAMAALPSMECAAVLSMLGALGMAPAQLAAVLDATTPRAQSPFALVFPVGDLLIGRGGRREGPTVPLKRHEAHPNSFELVVRTTRSSVSFQLQLHQPLPDGMATRTFLVPYMQRKLHQVDASKWLACGGELSNTCPVLTVATPPADQPLMFGVVVLVCPSSGTTGPSGGRGSASVVASNRTQQVSSSAGSSGHSSQSTLVSVSTSAAAVKVSAFTKRSHSAVGGAAEFDDGSVRFATKARLVPPAEGGGADPIQLQTQSGPNRALGLTCKYYNTPSGCRLGANCRFPHERASALPPSVHTAPQVQDDGQDDDAPDEDRELEEEPVSIQVCKYVNTPKGCRSGSNCKFAHAPATQASSFRAPTCTFLQTGQNFTEQIWYKCLTCRPNSGENWGLCEQCKLVCHRGHRLQQQGPSDFYCDCGSERPSKCQINGRGYNAENEHADDDEDDDDEEEEDEDQDEDQDEDEDEDDEQYDHDEEGDEEDEDKQDQSQFHKPGPRICKYVNTPAGCRNGHSCRFPHA